MPEQMNPFARLSKSDDSLAAECLENPRYIFSPLRSEVDHELTASFILEPEDQKPKLKLGCYDFPYYKGMNPALNSRNA